jgi:hypothetical protein
MYEVCSLFSGRGVSSSDLKSLSPSVFDSSQNGHSCHCTFLFMALRQMGIVNEIWGKGRPGKPFGVTLPSHPMRA